MTLPAVLGGCVGGPPGPEVVALAADRPPAPVDAVPVRSERIPTAAEIFDFHPKGWRPGTRREPFVVSYTEGPLNRYRLKTLAELRQLADHRYDFAAAPPR